MDVLSDVLRAVQLRGSLYFFTEFSSPWGVCVPRYGRVARFHLVLRGSCWVRVDGEAEPAHLAAGDLILVPHGTGHELADAPGTPCLTVDRVLEVTGFTGRGALVYGGEDRGKGEWASIHWQPSDAGGGVPDAGRRALAQSRSDDRAKLPPPPWQATCHLEWLG